MHRRVLVAALLVVMLAACGGEGGDSSTQQTTPTATVRWQSGLRAWGTGIRRAINGISVLFSRPADVRRIESGDVRAVAALRRFERTLAACTDRVQQLGAAPPPLRIARAEALHACISLERAAGLIRRGVAQVQGGQGLTLLDLSGASLAAGEDGVRRAVLDLSPAG
jgi:hypothetical protein